MSDKYSIDDILAEVDHKRGDTPKSTESVTEIIGDELKGYVHSSTRMPEEKPEEEISEEEENLRRAESIRRASEGTEQRRARLNRKKEEEEAKRREKEARLRAEEEKRSQKRPEKEREEQNVQFSAKRAEHSGYTSELSSPQEAS